MDKLSALIATHPKLFLGKPPAVASELPAGWFDIVDALCLDIEALLGLELERVEITQIKSKFGGLRFYYALEGVEDIFIDVRADCGVRTIVSKGDGPALMDQIRPLVAAASLRSTAACQDCGAPGVRATRGGWVETLCESHAQERERERQGDTE